MNCMGCSRSLLWLLHCHVLHVVALHLSGHDGSPSPWGTGFYYAGQWCKACSASCDVPLACEDARYLGTDAVVLGAVG